MDVKTVSETMIRVLHVVPDFRPGGAERMVVHLIRSLDDREFQVGVVSLYGPTGSELERELADNSIPVWYLGKSSGLDLRMFGLLNGIFRKFRPHIIHTHLYVGRYVWPVAKFCGISRLVHTVHSVASREATRLGQLIQYVAFHTGVVPVAIAAEVYRSVRKVYRTKICHYIPNGIPLEVYQSSNLTPHQWRSQEGFSLDSLLFVNVARLSPPKNHKLLIEAFACVSRIVPDVHLLLVGEGPERVRIEGLIEMWGVRNCIHLLGHRTDITDILSGCDVFVLASDWEGNPLSVMEAMTAGLPVISTDAGGVPELLDNGQAGLIVPRGNVAALAGAMQTLRDPAIRTRLSRRARTQSQARFDRRAMASAYQKLYQELRSKA